MKSLVLVALLATCLFAGSCVGSKSKPKVLFPTAQLMWPGVEEDLSRGLEDGVADGDLVADDEQMLRNESAMLGAAIHAKDQEELRLVSWLTLEPWAERGIADRLEDAEIGESAATLGRRRLAEFTETINALQGSL